MPDTSTKVQMDLDVLNDIFESTTGEAVVVPETEVEEKKPTVLQREQDIILQPGEKTPTKGEVTTETETEDTPAAEKDLSFEDIMDQNAVENKQQGRAKTDKSGIVELYKKKIQNGSMFPYNDFKAEPDEEGYEEKLEAYLQGLSMKDMEELWDQNLAARQNNLEEEIPQRFFDSLPEELQYAAKYVADGGTDLKTLFKVLAQVEEVKELDVEKDAKEIAYQYLRNTNFGTEEEIQEQLTEWEDLNVLGKKAGSFKPKLDQMHGEIVQRQVQEQEEQRLRREQAAQQYYDNVTEALKEPELAGVKLDKKTHDFLVQGLLTPAYPSISGRNTNLLGHLLEKHQVTNPNYGLVAEALWLLADPEGYRTKIREQGANNKAEGVYRQLKTEQSNKKGGQGQEQNENLNRQAKPNRVSRPGNIFKRPN